VPPTLTLPYLRRLRRFCLLAGLLPFFCTVPSAEAVEVVIEGVSGELQENVALWLGTPVNETPRALRSYEGALPGRAARALQALGYYEPQLQVSRDRTGEAFRFLLHIDPGKPVQTAAIDLRIAGEAEGDEAFAGLRAHLPLERGEVFRHDLYERTRRQLQNLALDRGYFDAHFTERRVEVDVVARKATVILHFDSGRRYALGEVQFPQTALAPWFLQRLVPFVPGAPYLASEIGALNRALLNSGYFAQVRVRPQPRAADAELRVPVEVSLTMERPHQVRVGAGYSTDVGPRLRLGWSRPWVNRRGHTLRMDNEFSEKRQNLTTRYGIPLRDPLRTRLVLQGGLQYEEIEEIESEMRTASIQHQHRFDSGWQQNLGIRWDREQFTRAENTQTTHLYIPGSSWSRSRARGGADPYWGDRLRLTVEGTDPGLGSDIDFLRVDTDARLLRTFSDNHRLLLRIDLGALTSSELTRVPPSLHFFAGGDQSVRGYRYQTLAPEDEAGNLIGGRYLATGTLEYGYRFHPSWRLALFTDAGNAFNDWDDPDPKVGAGFGLRWISPVGAIRLDLASAISRSGNPWRLHFSMGPEL